MSRFSAGIALGTAQVSCPPNEPRVRLRHTAAALCGYPASDPQAINEPGRTLWTKVDMSF